MLENSFIHLPSIGQGKEKDLWSSGITTWDQFLDAHKNNPKMEPHSLEIFNSKSALHEYDASYFARSLPRNELWRAWSNFKEKSVFLDIETTGLRPRPNSVTVVGLYDGSESRVFVQGKNLDGLHDALLPYKCVITFNGTSFDLPFLQKVLGDLPIPSLHIDLRGVLGSLGYRGGLKAIEKTLGLERNDDLAGLSGKDAVRLWRKYQKGDELALDKLIRYNIADIENLKFLMEFSYKKKKEALGFDV